jgi:uncharacterized protein
MPDTRGDTSLARPRYVPDTNVCLDLFVFGDPRCDGLLAAARDGRIELVTREDCRAEWRAVLGYPQLALSEPRRAQASALFDTLVHARSPEEVAPSPAALPRCRDGDDQKFLELAYQAGAVALLTRDDELLRLARRTKKEGLFAILPPASWQEVTSDF